MYVTTYVILLNQKGFYYITNNIILAIISPITTFYYIAMYIFNYITLIKVY